MKKGRPERVVEVAPEDPCPTDLYLIFNGRRIAKRGRPVRFPGIAIRG
jgi:hypothetical protein